MRVGSPGVAAWLRSAHRPATEIALAVVLYLVYEGGRALVAHSFDRARHDAALVIGAERSMHVFWEPAIQRAVLPLHALMDLLSGAYMTLHLAATALLLIWLYRRHQALYPVVRTALIVATALALVVHIAFPTAPPRLVGVAQDSVTNAHINLNSHILGVFYNPIAAMPSMHFGYALLIGLTLFKLSRRRSIRWLGLLYPLLLGFVIVATGNHFILDAAAGAVVMLAGWLVAAAVVCNGRAASCTGRLGLTRRPSRHRTPHPPPPSRPRRALRAH